MKLKDVLERLEKSCRERKVELIYDDLQSEGGLCRLRDRHYIIINRRAALATRVRILQNSLARIPTHVPELEETPPASWPPVAEERVEERGPGVEGSRVEPSDGTCEDAELGSEVGG